MYQQQPRVYMVPVWRNSKHLQRRAAGLAALIVVEVALLLQGGWSVGKPAQHCLPSTLTVGARHTHCLNLSIHL